MTPGAQRLHGGTPGAAHMYPLTLAREGGRVRPVLSATFRMLAAPTPAPLHSDRSPAAVVSVVPAKGCRSRSHRRDQLPVDTGPSTRGAPAPSGGATANPQVRTR
jgi:hypothetical protein